MRKIQELIQKQNDDKKASEHLKSLNEHNVLTEVNRVLEVMHNAERDAIKERIEVKMYNETARYEIRPVMCYIGSNSKISIRKDSVKITEHYSLMSNWYERHATIPLEYFDMDDKELYSTHSIWIHCAIDDILSKKEKEKKITKESIELQIKHLQKKA